MQEMMNIKFRMDKLPNYFILASCRKHGSSRIKCRIFGDFRESVLSGIKIRCEVLYMFLASYSRFGFPGVAG